MNISKLAPILIALVRQAICAEEGMLPSLEALESSDWEDLFRLATRHDLSPLLQAGTVRTRITPPEPIASALRRQAIAWELRNTRALEQLQKVLPAFHGGDIQAITLKGALFAAAYYSALGFRPFSDIDILVPVSQREEAARILMQLGYTLYEGEDQRGAEWWTENHHHWVFNQASCLPVELHWNLTSPCSQVQFEMQMLLQESKPIVIANGCLTGLRPEDQILHLATHSATHQFRLPLRQYVDLAVIMAASPDIDWAYLWQHARRIGAANDLTVYLGTAGQLGLITLPDAIAAEVKSNAIAGISWPGLASYAVSWPYLDLPCSMLDASAPLSLRTFWPSLRKGLLPAPETSRISSMDTSEPPHARRLSLSSHLQHLFSKFLHVFPNRNQIKTAIAINHHFSRRESP